MEENQVSKKDWAIGCGGCLGIIAILGIVLFLFMGCMADMTEDQKKEDNKQESKKEKDQKEIEETNKRLEEKAKKTEELNKKENNLKTDEKQNNDSSDKAMSVSDYKKEISSYRSQIQNAGSDLSDLSTEMNSKGMLTDVGKEKIDGVNMLLENSSFIIKGLKEEVIPPKKFADDHADLLEADEHYTQAMQHLDTFKSSEDTNDLDLALKELNEGTEIADIAIRNILN
ncbi:hypothetical protein [Mammaliicoccus sciuri]|uniref:hypothetical protein n=1 Tax=Mammaliicoccus sciuri TaxID=1296 RepID=UPI0020BEE946|nr:hypothetical protein [Mammaliicoccus sciuri]